MADFCTASTNGSRTAASFELVGRLSHRPGRVAYPDHCCRSRRPERQPRLRLVQVDASLPESEKYLHALTAAVQLSGIADRIGMSQTVQAVQSKMLDLFFAIRTHDVHFRRLLTWPRASFMSTSAYSGRTSLATQHR